jgi:hypothetical protein
MFPATASFREEVMKAPAVLVAVAALGTALVLPSVSAADPFCDTHTGYCPDARNLVNYEGKYVGHDEPSTLFYSNRAGSGNSNTWRLRLPHESPVLPTQNGKGGTWNFQLHPAFWFGMALCETQSYPNPGRPCRANSDTNIKDSSNPSSPNYIGKHAGTAFLELQFYPPGWGPINIGPGASCDAAKWCAAMAIFGLSDNQTRANNEACLTTAGEEFTNYAFITTNGVPHAPPDPLGATPATFAADPTKDLFMNAGDALAVSIHDSAAGVVTSITDTTTGQSGFMTASIGNGFAHPLFQPDARKCSEEPYAFHPMYSTSSEHTRVPWAAHSYNVAFSDEIGHFEYCNRANDLGICTTPGVNDPKLDEDDNFCLNANASLLVKIGGCQSFTDLDIDFDGTSYQRAWPGTLPDVSRDQQLHAQSFVFTSPLTGGQNYSRVAFEADLPRIEVPACNRETGAGCVNPPPGANFYPIYSTRTGGGACGWQEGGAFIPGTSNTFGGSSKSEYGSLLPLYYAPNPARPAATLINDFRHVIPSNPCPSTGSLPG